MSTMAKLILDKLTAIEERLGRIEGKIDDANFLGEVVADVNAVKAELPNAIVKVRKAKRKSTKPSKHLPHRVSVKLLEDSELAESTRNTYANTLRRLLENDYLVPLLVDERNKGVLYTEIEHMPTVNYSAKRLQNMVSVGLRYGVIERTESGQYRVGSVS